jgi:hypothetical protein
MGCAPCRRRELADTTESRFWGVLLAQSACRSPTFQAEAFLGFCAQRASDSPRRTRARCGPKRRNADRCRHTGRQGGTGALCAPTAPRPGSAPSRCHWMRPRQAPLAARRATPARRAHQSFDSPQGVISLGVHRKPWAGVCLREHAATGYRSQQEPARDDGSDGRLAAASVPSRYVAWRA